MEMFNGVSHWSYNSGLSFGRLNEILTNISIFQNKKIKGTDKWLRARDYLRRVYGNTYVTVDIEMSDEDAIRINQFYRDLWAED